MWWLVALACTNTPVPQVGELVFVRDGVLVPGEHESGIPVGGDRSWVSRAWSPGETVALAGLEGVAPAKAECLPLFHVALSDVSRLAVQGGVAPNAEISFSPDGGHLAVGSFQGDLVVVQGWTGEEISRTRLSEAMVKQLAWSRDGHTLYVAEQSPDGFLHAMDPKTLQTKWSFRAADHVETTALPPGEDRYAVYDLPAVYSLHVLENGDLLAVTTHGWNVADGSRKNASQVLRLDKNGVIKQRWPETPISVTMLGARVYEKGGGGQIVININRSADGSPPQDLPIGGVLRMDLNTLTPISQHSVAPLGPWFKSASLWHAFDFHPIHGVFLGFGDGRVMMQSLEAPVTTRVTLDTGAPIMAGEVPISASVGFGEFVGDSLLFVTSDTNIPWGAAAPELQPPTHHPGANGLFVVDGEGEHLWSWQGHLRMQGLSVSPNGTTAIIGGGFRPRENQGDLYGAVVFDLLNPTDGRSGDARRLATCATANPVFFDHEITDDGRVAVVEYPYPDGEGGIIGSYRATVLR